MTKTNTTAATIARLGYTTDEWDAARKAATARWGVPGIGTPIKTRYAKKG